MSRGSSSCWPPSWSAAKLLGEAAERIGQPAVLGRAARRRAARRQRARDRAHGWSWGGCHPRPRRARRSPAPLRDRAGDRPPRDVPRRDRLRSRSRSSASRCRSPSATSTGAYLPHPASGSDDLVTAAIFVGATLTATSVGITARVLSDLGRMSTPEARIIIGAAVIDDVLGLVILSVVSGVAAGASVSVLGIVRTLAVAVGFLVVAVLLGRFLAPRLFDVIVRMRVRYVLLVVSRSRSRSRWPVSPAWPGPRSSSGPSRRGSSSRAPTSSTPSSTRCGRSPRSSPRSSS